MIYNKYVIGDPHMWPIIKPTVEDSPWYRFKRNEIQNTLDSMKSLKRGWDSYDAKPIPISAITHAKSALEYGLKFGLYPLHILPSVVGGVGLTYPLKGTTSSVYVEFKEHSICLANLETNKVEELSTAPGLSDLENITEKITENILKHVYPEKFETQLIIILSNPPFTMSKRSGYISNIATEYGLVYDFIRLIDESPLRYPMFIDDYYLCHDLVKYANVVESRLVFGNIVLHSSPDTQQVGAKENMINCSSVVNKGKLIPLIGTSFLFAVERSYNDTGNAYNQYIPF